MIQKENLIKKNETIESDYINITKNSYDIKTILLHKIENEMSLPIINLNSNEKLKLSFDDISDNLSNLYLTIEHYNSDWKKSNLLKSEFIEGFEKDEIINYEYSFNTLKNYIHYEYIFPSENLKPIISGNYKMKIFDLNGDTIFSKKFMILDNKVKIDVNIKKATLSQDRKIKHEIDFIINHPNLNITDPFSQVRIVIKQNNKEDNAIRNLIPMYVRNNSLIYDYNEENTFFGNNEFRYFDIKSLRYFSEKIEDIKRDSSDYLVTLFTERKRSFDNYSIEPDINGQFYIKSQEARNSEIEAEYVNVLFKLNSDFIANSQVYIIGEFNNWSADDEYLLEYDFKQNIYNKKICFKQGYYNYHYAIKDTSLKHLDVASIEGTYYQTRNNYEIYVYFKDFNDRYEKLIGYTKELSKELF
mgnify:CR=1 FL=1|tara:strand:+ start:731 stop:1975 length:1245 start_codon:yes stop_codon:yes gene_type:complete